MLMISEGFLLNSLKSQVGFVAPGLLGPTKQGRVRSGIRHWAYMFVSPSSEIVPGRGVPRADTSGGTRSAGRARGRATSGASARGTTSASPPPSREKRPSRENASRGTFILFVSQSRQRRLQGYV